MLQAPSGSLVAVEWVLKSDSCYTPLGQAMSAQLLQAVPLVGHFTSFSSQHNLGKGQKFLGVWAVSFC